MAAADNAKPRAVLTRDQAVAIFLLRPTGTKWPHGRRASLPIAQAFGVSEKTVRDIWSARTWYSETRHLDLSRPARAERKPGRPKGRKDSVKRQQKLAKNAETNSGFSASTHPYDPFHDDWPHWDRADCFSLL